MKHFFPTVCYSVSSRNSIFEGISPSVLALQFYRCSCDISLRCKVEMFELFLNTTLLFTVPYFKWLTFLKGWTPSAFISSRQKRADRTILGPEDFMDEEVHLEINTSLLEVVAMTASFSGHEKRT